MYNKLKDFLIKFLHGAVEYRVVYTRHPNGRMTNDSAINYKHYSVALNAYNSIDAYTKEMLLIYKDGSHMSLKYHSLSFLDDYGV